MEQTFSKMKMLAEGDAHEEKERDLELERLLLLKEKNAKETKEKRAKKPKVEKKEK